MRPASRRWWLLLLLFLGVGFNYVHRQALSLAAPVMMGELNFTAADMGVLLSAFFWSYALLQVPAGWLSDRFGVARIYGISFAFSSIISALTALARGVASLAMLRTLLGVGQAATFPASNLAISTWFQDRERGTATGLFLAGNRVVPALMAPVGAYLLQRFGWQGFFLLTGFAPLILLLPWRRFFARAPERTAATHARAASPVGGPSLPRESEGLLASPALFRQRTVWGIVLGFFCYDYGWFVYLTWLPGYLVLERKFTLGQMGVFTMIPLLAMALVIPLSGWLGDQFVRRGARELTVRKIFITVGFSIGCLIVPAGWVSSPTTCVWLLTLSLCGIGVVSPHPWALTQLVSPRRAVGTVSGIQNFGGNLGGVLAPAVTGFIAHATGSFFLALALTGLVLVCGIASYWLLLGPQVLIETQGEEREHAARG